MKKILLLFFALAVLGQSRGNPPTDCALANFRVGWTSYNINRCSGDPFTFTFNATVNPGFIGLFSYTVGLNCNGIVTTLVPPGLVTNQTLGSKTVTLPNGLPAGCCTLTVFASFGSGPPCTASTSFPVTIFQKACPTVTSVISGVNALCLGEATTLTINPLVSANPA